MPSLRLVIITGLSGAGKTEAMHSFEDLGYFCVDNLPPALIPKFAELCRHSEGRVTHVALVSDIRGGSFFDALFAALGELEAAGFSYEILFLEAPDDVLVRRFKEARRRHPLAPEGSILGAITAERQRLARLRQHATYIIDTGQLSGRELRVRIAQIFGMGLPGSRLGLTVVSFGFRYGLPMDADMVFDCRFLPNPYYVPELKHLTGQDEPVRQYVLRWPQTQQFLDKLLGLMDFLLPQFEREGKTEAVIAIGCTGGRHRSVTLAEVIADDLRRRGYHPGVLHRDMNRGGSTAASANDIPEAAVEKTAGSVDGGGSPSLKSE
ncbi:MAG: RNase adapter RapZ [Firmicutes bacterium]|nr:RNase adapter RapZ [Bacillota bacterium]